MKQRSIGLMILFSIITFGIYLLVWYIMFHAEVRKKSGEGLGLGVHILLMFITFGIYLIVWAYFTGKRLEKIGGVDNSVLYLVLAILLSFVLPFVMQNQGNKLTGA